MVESVTPVHQSEPQALPSPAEMRAFLAEHHQIDSLDPDRPHQFWPERGTVESPPFSNDLVQELRGLNRDHLRMVNDGMGRERAKVFVPEFSCNDNNTRVPTSATLFEAVGAHLEPRHRLDVAMRMARVTRQTAVWALTPDAKDADSLSNYLNDAEAKPYAHLPELCAFLGVEQQWIERGPTVSAIFEDPPHPWWLAPWWELSNLTCELFEMADRRGLLPMCADRSGYDFAAFWARWTANPAALPLHKEWVSRPLHLLPWLFEARSCFRCGKPTYSITCTAATWSTLQRLMRFYTYDCLPALGDRAGKILPGCSPTSAAPPTLEDMMELNKWMNSPEVANLVLTSPDGTIVRFSPLQMEPPNELACDRGRPKPGRRPKSAAPSSPPSNEQ